MVHAQDSHGVHHFHKRKRKHQKLEPYPHPEKLKRIFDKLVYVAVVVGPIMTIPQLYSIWIQQNAAGVSIATWLTYMITAIFWLIYAILHKEKPLIASSVAWVILDALVVLGALIY